MAELQQPRTPKRRAIKGLESDLHRPDFPTTLELAKQPYLLQDDPVKLVVLNHSAQLNAFDSDSLAKLSLSLNSWNKHKRTIAALLAGSNNCFSAGTNYHMIYDAIKSGNQSEAQTYLRQVNHFIASMHTSDTAVIPVINGLCLGSAASLAVHCPYTCTTERACFAFPETALGLVPDTGSTYFLGALGPIGTFLALTNTRINGYQLVHFGLTPYAITSSSLPLLKEALETHPARHPARIVQELYHVSMSEEPDYLHQYRNIIQECFSAPTVEEIITRLKKARSPWAFAQAAKIEANPPLATKLTLKLLQDAQENPDATPASHMQRSYQIQNALLNHTDFQTAFESRVLKSASPSAKWSHTLSEVNDEFLTSMWNKKLWPELSIDEQYHFETTREVARCLERSDVLPSMPPVVAEYSRFASLHESDNVADGTPPVGPDGLWHAQNSTTWDERGAVYAMGNLVASIPGHGRGTILEPLDHPHLEPPIASELNDNTLRQYELYDLSRTSPTLRWLVDFSSFPVFPAIRAATRTSVTNQKELLDSLVKGDPRRAAAAAAAPASIEEPRPLPFAPNPALRLLEPIEIKGEFDEDADIPIQTQAELAALESGLFHAAHYAAVNDPAAWDRIVTAASKESGASGEAGADADGFNAGDVAPAEPDANASEAEKQRYADYLTMQQLENGSAHTPTSAEEWNNYVRIEELITGSSTNYVPAEDSETERQLSLQAAHACGSSHEFEVHVAPSLDLRDSHRSGSDEDGVDDYVVDDGDDIDNNDLDEANIGNRGAVSQPDPTTQLADESIEVPNLEASASSLEDLALYTNMLTDFGVEPNDEEFPSVVESQHISNLDEILELCAEELDESTPGGVVSTGERYDGEQANDPADVEAAFGADGLDYGVSHEPLPVSNARVFTFTPETDPNEYQDLSANQGTDADYVDDQEAPLPVYPEREMRYISETLADRKLAHPKHHRVNIGRHKTVRYTSSQLY